MAIGSVKSSYDAHGLAQNDTLAKKWQKHPRCVVRARYPHFYVAMKQSIAGAAYQDPVAVTLSATTVVHTAAIGTVVGNLGATFDGTGSAPAMTYALVNNPNSYFKIVGAALQVNAALVVGTVAISIKGTSTPESSKSATTSFNITVT